MSEQPNSPTSVTDVTSPSEQELFEATLIKVIDMYRDANRTECPLSELEKMRADPNHTSCFSFYNTESLDLIEECIKWYQESMNISQQIMRSDPRFSNRESSC